MSQNDSDSSSGGINPSGRPAAQYIPTFVRRSPRRRDDIKAPCDRIQITDLRDEPVKGGKDGRIKIELIRQVYDGPGQSTGIEVEECYLSGPGESFYASNAQTGKTVQAITWQEADEADNKPEDKPMRRPQFRV
jgi:hypothetical protein